MNDRKIGSISSDATLCIGTSMYPTLRALDTLTTEPLMGRKLRCGDVVLFEVPGRSRVAHRVVKITREGIRTRGDNNDRIDGRLLLDDDVIGIVIGVRRLNQEVRVYGGLAGRIIGHKCRIIRTMKRLLAVVLRPGYDLASRSGVFRLWLPAGLRPRIVSFSRPEKVDMQLVIGKTVIGLYDPDKCCWAIRPPYRLFVDEDSLPPKPGRQIK